MQESQEGKPNTPKKQSHLKYCVILYKWIFLQTNLRFNHGNLSPLVNGLPPLMPPPMPPLMPPLMPPPMPPLMPPLMPIMCRKKPSSSSSWSSSEPSSIPLCSRRTGTTTYGSSSWDDSSAGGCSIWLSMSIIFCIYFILLAIRCLSASPKISKSSNWRRYSTASSLLNPSTPNFSKYDFKKLKDYL